jgi:hypothetical protein
MELYQTDGVATQLLPDEPAVFHVCFEFLLT